MAAIAAKLSPQDAKDLEKYLRYFVYKSVQVIVQSRVGDRQSIPSKQFASGADWFNLTVRDDPEVLAEVKRMYPGPGGGLAGGDIVCVETLLRTQSGEALPLETWWMKMGPPCDIAARVSFTVYSRIGSLLKSLFIASRSVPAYRLSRHHGTIDNYCNIYYRVYVGAPTFDLGASYSTQTIGSIPTPTGTVQLLLAYRPQLVIRSQDQAARSLELCDDYFKVVSSPDSGSVPATCWHALSKFQQPDIGITKSQLSSSPPDHNRMVSVPSGLSRLDEDISQENRLKVAAFGSGPSTPSSLNNDLDAETSVPFGQLLDRHDTKLSPKRLSSGSETAAGVEPMVLATSGSSASDREGRGTAHCEDFVVLELKTPFAGASSLVGESGERDEGDLGRFYRECQSAPVLSMFQQSTTNVHELLNSITDQLAQFEANAKDFDDFVNSFQET